MTASAGFSALLEQYICQTLEKIEPPWASLVAGSNQAGSTPPSTPFPLPQIVVRMAICPGDAPHRWLWSQATVSLSRFPTSAREGPTGRVRRHSERTMRRRSAGPWPSPGCRRKDHLELRFGVARSAPLPLVGSRERAIGVVTRCGVNPVALGLARILGHVAPCAGQGRASSGAGRGLRRSAVANSLHSSSGSRAGSALSTWTATWSAPASRCSYTR